MAWCTRIHAAALPHSLVCAHTRSHTHARTHTCAHTLLPLPLTHTHRRVLPQGVLAVRRAHAPGAAAALLGLQARVLLLAGLPAQGVARPQVRGWAGVGACGGGVCVGVGRVAGGACWCAWHVPHVCGGAWPGLASSGPGPSYKSGKPFVPRHVRRAGARPSLEHGRGTTKHASCTQARPGGVHSAWLTCSPLPTRRWPAAVQPRHERVPALVAAP